MANSMNYNGDKFATAIANLEKVNTSLTDLKTAISNYQSTYSNITWIAIDRKIDQMATKYDENDQPYIDTSDYRYYWNYYGNPLYNATRNISTIKNSTSTVSGNVNSVNSAFNAVVSAVALYEEIPDVKDDELDAVAGSLNGTESDPSNGYHNFGNVTLDSGVGKADINIDLNGDGVPDLNIDTNGDGKADTNIDLNMDGVPDLNIDTNGDGKADLNIDLNGDGKPDLNVDTDGDGKADLNIDTNGDGVPDLNVDKDGDGKADVDIDTNDDGKEDTDIDTDGDGEADTNIDTNEDGKADTNIDIDGDGKADINIDINNDGVPDINIDLDGDGKADVNVDVNGDGNPDLNIDTDGDGIADTNIDANGNGIIDSEEKKKPTPPGTTLPPKTEGEDTDEPEGDTGEPPQGDDGKTGEENADELVDIGEVVIPDIGGGDDTTTGDNGGDKGAGTISNIGTAIADSVTSVEDELIGGVIEDEKPSIPDALLGGNGNHGISEFDASGSYKNAQGPAAQAGVGIAGIAALGIAAASGGTAISGVLEENNEDSDLTNEELNKRKRIRTIITSASLVVLSLGFTLTQILRPGSVITILLFGIAILISAIASIFGTNIGKTVTTISSLVLLFVTFILAAFNVVSPLGYIIALIVLLTVFLVVYIFDLFKEFVDNKVMIPSFVAVVALNAFGLLKVFEVVNWLIYLLLAGLGIAVYLWYERYYGQGFDVVNKLKNEDKRKFFN